MHMYRVCACTCAMCVRCTRACVSTHTRVHAHTHAHAHPGRMHRGCETERRSQTGPVCMHAPRVAQVCRLPKRERPHNVSLCHSRFSRIQAAFKAAKERFEREKAEAIQVLTLCLCTCVRPLPLQVRIASVCECACVRMVCVCPCICGMGRCSDCLAPDVFRRFFLRRGSLLRRTTSCKKLWRRYKRAPKSRYVLGITKCMPNACPPHLQCVTPHVTTEVYVRTQPT